MINYFDIEELETKLFFKVYNKSITSTSLSKSLKTITKKYFKKSIGIKEYRHLITYIIKEKIAKNNIELLSPKANRTFSNYYKAKDSNIEDILANHSTLIANTNYARDTNYFSNKTRDITNRSLNFCRLYFNYFNLVEDRTIKDVLDTNLEASTISTNTSSLYTNKSKKEDNITNTNKTLSTIDSSSINISNNSKEDYKSTTNILEDNSSNKSYRNIENSSSSNLNIRTKANTLTNKLTNNTLDRLEKEIISPSKNTIINNYLDNINKPLNKKTSNVNTNNLDLDLDLDLNKLFKKNNNNINIKNKRVISSSSSSSSNLNIISKKEEKLPSIFIEEEVIPSTSIKKTTRIYYNKENTTTNLERNFYRLNRESSLTILSSTKNINRDITRLNLRSNSTIPSSSKRSYSNRESSSSSSSSSSRESNINNKKEELIAIEKEILEFREKKRNRGRPKKIKTKGRSKKEYK